MRRPPVVGICKLACICVLAIFAAAAAPRAEQDFVAANELALKGDLPGAIALYRSLADQGVEHEDLWYNLGNAYAQSGRPIDAILAWERALRLAPNDRDARANLEVVRAKLGAIAPAAEGDVVLADVVEPLIAPFSRKIFAWIAVAANALLFAALLLRRRATSERRRRTAGAASAIAALALALSLVVVAGHFVIARDPRAVVTENAELKEGPHVRFKTSGRLNGGERVRVMEEDGGFVRVLRTDGTSGWMPVKSIARL